MHEPPIEGIAAHEDLAWDDARGMNQRVWDERVEVHAGAPSYELDRIADDPEFLSGVARYDHEVLGLEVAGQRVLHLQCHIGTDTVSLAKLGATEVVGYDFSPPALDVAADLARRAGVAARWYQGDVYDAPEVLGGEQFDVVYTGVGAIIWLPDIARWAEVVAACLAPGGTFFIRDGHPLLFTLHHERSPDLVVAMPYFEQDAACVWDEQGSYADKDARFEHTATAEWNHSLSEIVMALLGQGLVLEDLGEHTVIDWQPFELFEPIDDGYGHYALPAERRGTFPVGFHLRCTKPATTAP